MSCSNNSLTIEEIVERPRSGCHRDVAGDVHSLGRELVTLMLEGSGFKVIDLGEDVDASGFIEAAVSKKVQIVAMSGLLTTSRITMRETIEAFDNAGLR